MQQPVKPAAHVETLAVPLKAIAESWPEALRQELVRSNLLEKSVQVPCDLIETALKCGRAKFPWKSIRSWVQPAPLREGRNLIRAVVVERRILRPLPAEGLGEALTAAQRFL